MPVEQTGEVGQENSSHYGVDEQGKIIRAECRKHTEKFSLFAQIHFHVSDEPVPSFGVERNFPVPLMQKVNDKQRDDEMNRSPENARLSEGVRQRKTPAPIIKPVIIPIPFIYSRGI